MAQVAVCFQINTKHNNTVWAECQFLSYKSVGARNLKDLKVQIRRKYRAVPLLHLWAFMACSRANFELLPHSTTSHSPAGVTTSL